MFWNFQPSLCRELGLLCPKTAKAFAERFKQRLSILNKLPSMIEALSNTKSLVKPCYLAYSMRQLTTAIWQIKANDTPVMHQRVSTKSAGFTLIELLVVILLLAILSTVSVVSFEGVQDESMVDVTKFEMQELKKALLQFKLDNGAFPCGVYNEEQRPYELDVGETAGVRHTVYAIDDTNFPPTTATLANIKNWCEGNGASQYNALLMLMKFPFDASSAAYTGGLNALHPPWNTDTKRGWRGPYLSSAEALKDAWGGYYRLLDPELDFKAYELDKRWCGLDITGTFYECQTGNDAIHNKLNDSARVVSNGPDRLPNTIDDISLDLLK